jgi:D-alanyl-D-alanine carboxypeptidase
MKTYLFIPMLLCGLFISEFTLGQSNYSQLDTLLNRLERNQKFMGNVGVWKDGKMEYARAIGLASADGKKNQVSTKFRLGSVTKTFTSVIIFQLIQEGKISLETKLSSYYPQIPNANKITIKHMLQHRSGIFNFTNDQAYLSYMTQPKTKAELLEIISKYPSDFEPGEKFNYSNSTFVLLGFIVEEIEKESYADILKKKIINPLNLNNTYISEKPDPLKNEAISFMSNGSNWIPGLITHPSIPGAAGAITSNIEDLAIFCTALFDGKLLNMETVSLMIDDNERVGHGIFIMPFSDNIGYGHGGRIDGFEASIGYFPEHKMALVITGNGMNYGMNDISIAALNVAFGFPYKAPEFSGFKPDFELLANLEGNYGTTQVPLKIKLWNENGSLMAQASGQGAFKLDAESELVFIFSAAGLKMEFIKEEDGTIQRFNLIQGGAKLLFEKE